MYKIEILNKVCNRANKVEKLEKLEEFHVGCKYEVKDTRLLKAYLDWTRERPDIKYPYLPRYLLAQCDKVPGTPDYFDSWKCKDVDGLFLVSRFRCSSNE